MRDAHEPDLFDFQPAVAAPGAAAPLSPPPVPPALVVAFPPAARVAKVRDVARKLVATKSEKHAEAYRVRVTEALRGHLTSKFVPVERHERLFADFWQQVDLEAARIVRGNRRTPGGAA